MANSVSKIHVQVGANISQLETGMQQAATAVQGGIGKIGGIAQQATFAVDDFFAAFQTGGVAGGLRGAANNLSAIAMSFGGVKVALAGIAAIAVGQLTLKWWEDSERKKIEAATDAIAKWRREIDKSRDASSAAIQAQAGISELTGMGKGGLVGRQKENSARLKEVAAEMKAEQELLDSFSGETMRLQFADNPTKADEARLKAMQEEMQIATDRLDSLRKEALERSKIGALIQDQLNNIKRGADEQERMRVKQFQFQPFITREMRSAMSGQIMDIDEEIAGLRESMRPSFSMADMFRMLPGANTMGSGGAVSAINAAMAGPQNARDSGPALQRETNSILKRIEELEKKKKGLVEVIGL